MMNPLIEVGYDKGELDFGVNCSIYEFDYEKMNALRSMLVVAIGVMEEGWCREQSKKHPVAQRLFVISMILMSNFLYFCLLL